MMLKAMNIVVIVLSMTCVGMAAPVVMDPQVNGPADIELIRDTPTDVVLEFRLGELNVDTVESADQSLLAITIAGWGLSSENGYPELPQQSVWLRLSSTSADVEILEDDVAHYRWGVVQPAPDVIYRQLPLLIRRRPDETAYHSTHAYPGQPAALTVHGNLASAAVGLLTFTPVQYNPLTQECIVHHRLRIRVSSQRSGNLDQAVGVPLNTRRIVERIVINHGDDNPPIAIGPRMIVVTEPQFVPALDSLLIWKYQSGLLPRLVIYSSVASSAEGLQSYIRQLADSLPAPPEFLLIIGDVDMIPSFYGVDNSLTDHPYSLLTESDYLPDLSVGRIPCQTVDQCSDWVDRVLDYERDGSTIAFEGTVFSSSAALDPLHGIHVTSLMSSAGLSVDQFQQPETGSLSNLLTSLNSGSQWVFYIGHGHAQAWSSVQPDFTNASINSLTAPSSPIVVSVACATADLDFSGMSLAEYWITRQGLRGPLAYFGATESTAFFRSDTIGIAALRAVFRDECERLGTAADLGRIECAQSFPQPPGGLTEETIQQFVLLGDPSMRVYSRPPQPLTADYPPVIPIGESNFSITVLSSNQPVANADICISSEIVGIYEFLQTNSTGTAQISISANQSAVLNLTITALNSSPYLGQISVAPGGAPLLDLGALVVSDSNGDNDSQADRGEACNLQISVINRGGNTASGGTLSLTCSDPNVAVDPIALSVPPIAPRDTIRLDGLIPALISDSASDGYVAILNSAIVVAGDTIRRATSLRLHAPILQYVGSSVRMDSANQNLQWFSLTVQFVNSGSDRAMAPHCDIIGLPAEVSLSDSHRVASDVQAGDTLTVAFHLQSAAALPRGYALNFAYRFAAGNLSEDTGAGVVHVGQIPALLYVLDSMPQEVDAAAAILASFGLEYERSALLPADLFRFASIWIFCGVYPNNVSLPNGEASRLAAYLDGGGNCYWEGGDVWVFDERNALHPYFHILGMSDGTSNAGPILGESAPLSGIRMEYAGENSFIDQLAPDTNAQILLRNDRLNVTYPVCIAYAGNGYRTVGSSIELSLLTDNDYPSTRISIFREIVRWFHIEPRADTFPPLVLHEPPESYPMNHLIRIDADIQDVSGVASADVVYRVDDGAVSTLPMSFVSGLFTAEIPAIAAGLTLHYRIHAADSSPLHNSSAGIEWSAPVIMDPTIALHTVFDRISVRDLGRSVIADSGASYSITGYPTASPVLELHGTAHGLISYTTESFDCSDILSPTLKFWHYLRDVSGSQGTIARVVGSADGGRTFAYSVWQSSAGGRDVLDEGYVTATDLAWMCGQSDVVLRFEYSGGWYWRLGEITVSGATAPVYAAIRDLVIAPTFDGLRLTWQSAAKALYYEVMASSGGRSTDAWVTLCQTSDTTFIDTTSNLTQRYYAARAVIAESIPPAATQISANADPMASIRLPDLRWNRKMEHNPR